MAGRKARYNPIRKAGFANYRDENRREENKAYKLLRVLRKTPDDQCAKKALDSLPEYCIEHANKRLVKERIKSRG